MATTAHWVTAQRRQVRIDGIVQGVGFRPFVHRLALDLGLAGTVANDARGVIVEVEGAPPALERFLERLVAEAPALAVIEGLDWREVALAGDTSFRIVESDGAGRRDALVSPDVATCDDCLRELADPSDRRYRYPFVNCTNCGPRFTIVRDVPYDRANTTMAGFEMCDECRAEFEDPSDRRFHAQPVCCPACGPSLRLLAPDGSDLTGAVDPLAGAVDLLAGGGVVAVKGLGGYHLAARADHEGAVASLRARKYREEKPFALMVDGVEAARELCEVSEEEARLLRTRSRPIVLLRRRPGAAVAASVAPRNRDLGVMLPYTPLHHLLLAGVGRPIVLTSGNVSDEPIAYDDADALARLVGIADAFLTHDRAIHVRADDSVARVMAHGPVLLRRSRGEAPRPLLLPRAAARPTLACGAELKHTFCLARDRHAFLSQHVGDLENHETFQSFVDGVERFCRLFDVTPEVVAHDLHPEYLSTKYALDLDGVDLVAVQHHHAHIASCLADNGEDGPVIGVAFDGLGLGDDGTLWGGEFLVADHASFERVAHFETIAMPGGTAAIREPWRMAVAWADRLGLDVAELAVAGRHAEQWQALLQAVAAGINAPVTSSAGRLFDAVAAILGVRDSISYEGQAAIELEQLVDPGERGAYRAGVAPGAPMTVQVSDLVAAVVDDVRAGAAPPTVAARFHRGLAATVVDACEAIRAQRSLGTVALSGGVFQNAVLVGLVVPALAAAGFRVLTHRQVPPNDGGISVGQVAVAAGLHGGGA